MNQFSRGEFLRRASISIGALALSALTGCSSPEEASPVVSATSTVEPSKTVPSNKPGFTPQPEQETAVPANYPDLVAVRNGEPEDMIRRAIAALGGMEKFVPSGSTVVIKPNICVAYHTYEYAATTNPWVVGALVSLCFEAGAVKVKVMDNPFGGTAEEAYKRSSIGDVVQAVGGEMVQMVRRKFISTEIPGATSLKSTEIYEDILNSDVLIDVPVAKNHGLAQLTLGMKNLMGVIRDRGALHANIGPNLADLAGFLRPDLTVIDGVRVMLENGPTGGSLDYVKQMNTVIASQDIVAADSYAAKTLFGKDPFSLAYIQAGADAGLGTGDLESVKIEEISIS